MRPALVVLQDHIRGEAREADYDRATLAEVLVAHERQYPSYETNLNNPARDPQPGCVASL